MGIAPITFLPGLNDRWGWPVLLCAVVAVVLAGWGRPVGRLPTWIAALIGGVLLVLLIGALMGPAPMAQLLGRAPRYEGMLTLGALVGTGWAAARIAGPNASQKLWRHLLRALTVSSILLAAVAVLESFGLRPIPSDLARPGSLAGNATDQAILGALFVAVLGAAVIGGWRRTGQIDWWVLGGFAAGIVSVATSASRAGLLSLAIVAVGLAVFFITGAARRGRATLIALGIAAAVFLLAISVPLTRSRLFGTSTLSQQTVTDRFVMWEDAWQLIQSRPWGVGLNGYADAITPFFGDEWFERAEVGAILDSPHNVILQAIAVGGFLGAAVAAVLIGGVLFLGIRHLKAAATGPRRDVLVGGSLAVVGSGVALLTHVTSPVTLVPLAFLVGVLVSVPPRVRKSASKRWGIMVLGIVGAVFVIVCMIADGALLDARVAARSGDIPRAVASFETAQALRPWDVDVALTAANALGGAAANEVPGAAEAAAEWADRAVRELPDSARAQFVAGMIASASGDVPQSVPYLERAAELSPADPRIHHELGVAHLVLGDFAAARPELERAAELAPYSGATWNALRDTCAALGDDECVREASEALSG